jgi:hypothetical protein
MLLCWLIQYCSLPVHSMNLVVNLARSPDKMVWSRLQVRGASLGGMPVEERANTPAARVAVPADDYRFESCQPRLEVVNTAPWERCRQVKGKVLLRQTRTWADGNYLRRPPGVTCQEAAAFKAKGRLPLILPR